MSCIFHLLLVLKVKIFLHVSWEIRALHERVFVENVI